jgi:GNAT superfamily N-acetyltransferase
MSSEGVEVRKVNLGNISQEEANEILFLLNTYACDPMGGGEPLSEETRTKLVPELVKRKAWCHIFIARKGSQPVGIANCLEGFSSFSAKPLINIHDIAVIPEFRGKGVGTKLLRAVEAFATSIDCCKITLEVLEGNTVAQNAYRAFGFRPYQLDPKAGVAQFWEYKINT